MTDYYSILQISNNATIEDVKKAYRKLARQYHPDVNHNQNAHETFILITEAYEYLIKKLTTSNNISSNWQEKKEKAQRAQDIIDDWLATERERIRARARKHAQMKYSQFKKTPYYKATEVRQNQIVAILSIFVGVFVMIMSVLGSLKAIEENEKLRNANYIGATIIVFIMGMIVTIAAIYKLFSYIRKKAI